MRLDVDVELKEKISGALKIDSELSLYSHFVPLLLPRDDPPKKTTVRFGGGAIRIPKSRVLPLYETKPSCSEKRYIGQVMIPSIDVKVMSELSDSDGVLDGFSGKEELVNVIRSIYKEVSPDSLVSIYRIHLL